MTTKNTYDIHALQFAFDVCIKLAKKHTANADKHNVCIEAADIFIQAIKDADAEGEAMRKELEARAATPEVGFTSQGMARFAGSLQRAGRTWNDYVDDHCESMKDIDLLEVNVPEVGEDE